MRTFAASCPRNMKRPSDPFTSPLRVAARKLHSPANWPRRLTLPCFRRNSLVLSQVAPLRLPLHQAAAGLSECTAPRVTRLLNDAMFQFERWDGDMIRGFYLDLTGAWTPGEWDEYGKVAERTFSEFDLNWRSGRVPDPTEEATP